MADVFDWLKTVEEEAVVEVEADPRGVAVPAAPGPDPALVVETLDPGQRASRSRGARAKAKVDPNQSQNPVPSLRIREKSPCLRQLRKRTRDPNHDPPADPNPGTRVVQEV